MNIKKIIKTLYHFKSIQFRQYRYDKNGNYLDKNKTIETTVHLHIENKCSCLFLTEHKYTVISWLLMIRKIPNMYNKLSHYC